MSYLDVPAARIYYESVGQGPILLCITGALGNVEPFRGLAEQPQRPLHRYHHAANAAQGRGFSRSLLSASEPQDYDNRIQTDADDAAHLIKHISPQEPVTVLGSSSGAVVALGLLVRHPDIVRTLIPHEPPAHNLLPDFEELSAGTHQLYQLYRRSGMPPALTVFAKAVKIEDEAPFLMQAFNPQNDPFTFSSAQYWFEREILYYPARKFNMETLGSLRDKLLLAVGEMSNVEAAHYRPNVLISQNLGLDLIRYPGAHLGFASHPQQFAQKLLETLEKTGRITKEVLRLCLRAC